MNVTTHPICNVSTLLGFATVLGVALFGVTTLTCVARGAEGSVQAPDLPQGDACLLLTTAQASDALGVTLLEGEPLLPSTKTLCVWNEPGGPTVVGKKLTLSLMTAKAYALAREPESGLAKSKMNAIGDDAYLIVSNNFGVALSVKKGNTYFQLRVSGFQPERARDIEKALALQVVSGP